MSVAGTLQWSYSVGHVILGVCISIQSVSYEDVLVSTGGCSPAHVTKPKSDVTV